MLIRDFQLRKSDSSLGTSGAILSRYGRLKDCPKREANWTVSRILRYSLYQKRVGIVATEISGLLVLDIAPQEALKISISYRPYELVGTNQ